eukprot:GHVS01102894.1.p1 GENE.GHVS01102894.1~~GHVS01102894.1.p1  ORF type:complete len:902 (+),score=86.04 GHVS01102894.1:67-2706(+)
MQTSSNRSELELLRACSRAVAARVSNEVGPQVARLSRNFADSWDVTRALHSTGVNMRSLGDILEQDLPTPVHDIAVIEILARTAKHLWLAIVDKLIKSGEQSADRLQRSVVNFFNTILGSDEETFLFWQYQLLPAAMTRFGADLLERASPRKINVPVFFRALQHHLAVQFDASVWASSECLSRWGSLKLPLSQADLATFSGRNASLFPEVEQVRAMVLGGPTQGGGQNLSHADRFIRGFYPRIRSVAPRTLSCLRAATDYLCDHARHIHTPLQLVLPMLKSGLHTHTEETAVLDSCNPTTMGNAGPLRACIFGVAFPCHPVCDIREIVDGDYAKTTKKTYLEYLENVESDENEEAEDGEEEEQEIGKLPTEWEMSRRTSVESGVPSGAVCLNFERLLAAVTTHLTVSELLSSDALETAKLVIHLAYVWLQHGYPRRAQHIAAYVMESMPNIGEISGDAIAVVIQTLLRTEGWKDALPLYRQFNAPGEFIEKTPSLRQLQLSLCMTAYCVHKKMYEEAVVLSESSYRLSLIIGSASHWTAMTAMRLQGRCLAETGRFADAAAVLQVAVRAGEAAPQIPPYITAYNRCLMGEVLEKLGKFEFACVQVMTALRELEDTAGSVHCATLTALYMAARMKQRVGCQDIWKMLDVGGADPYTAKCREEAVQLYGNLFRRLLSKTLSNKDIRATGVMGGHLLYMETDEQRQSRLYAVIKQILAVKLSDIGIKQQRELLDRLYCVVLSEYGPKFNQDLTYMREIPQGNDSHTDPIGIRVFGNRRKITRSKSVATSAIEIAASSLPSREHVRATLRELLFCQPTLPMAECCKDCLDECLLDRRLLPDHWFDVTLKSVIQTTGKERSLHIVLNMLRELMTPAQKEAFLAL